MNNSRRTFLQTSLVAGAAAIVGIPEVMAKTASPAPEKATLNLTTEWDKTFPKSDKVDHKKVTFINRYGITLAEIGRAHV